jgi:hypothetical protein
VACKSDVKEWIGGLPSIIELAGKRLSSEGKGGRMICQPTNNQQKIP